ncbi:TolC family outer membrane protein [Thiomicrorhabdus arctica]|uniref:TolC family outer membrane protein n=1 Tax=Thiomicrorhabdus arctica TaxID=131540 RepID=UPI00035DA24D|nr:TolC family outer membrane protein [Thiomicrorhabdus arctica]
MKMFNGSLSRLGFVVSSGVLCLATVNSVQASATAGLMDVYQMASLHDAKLSQARVQYQADRQGLKTAKSYLLPQIQADGSYFKTDSSNDSYDMSVRDLSLTLNQPLYQHETWAAYEQVKQSLKTSEYVMQSAEQDLILRVTEAYFNVLLAQQDLQLFKAKENADNTQLERAQASSEVGLASRVDVLQAKSSYDLSKSDRITGENSLDISLEQLSKLTGQSLTRLKGLSMQVALPKADRNTLELESRVDTQNLAVKQAASQVLTAEQEIEVKKGGYWPSVNFQAKYTDSAYSDFNGRPSYFTTDAQKTSVGVTVTVPLYSGGGTDSQVSAARYQFTVAKEALRDSKEQARLNVRIQARTLEAGESLISALREAVKSNDAFLAAAEEGYQVGLKSLLEVLTARSNQYAARKNLVAAIHNQVLNTLRLESSLGDLTIDDLMVFDKLLQEPVKVAKPSA